VRARELLAKARRKQCRAQYQLGLMLGGRYRRHQGRYGCAESVREGGRAKSRRRAGADGRVHARRPRRPKDSSAAKVYYERAAALGDEDAKKALKRIECPYAIKDSAAILSPIFAFSACDYFCAFFTSLHFEAGQKFDVARVLSVLVSS